MFNITWRINSFRSSLTRRINPSQYIRRKLIQVTTTCQPNRVLIHKPTRIRLIIPEEAVMQPRFTVVILVWQSEALVSSSGYVDFALQFTPIVIIPESNQITFIIDHLTWDADLVAVEVVGMLDAFSVFGYPIANLC